MDEDECNFQSPIGQIIKHINVICKKPHIDNQLGEALDLFNKRIDEQQKYLSNGIFKTNFAEAALFLQSCAELYGKKIDLLWDELISYLTRLIQYDCEHEKEQGKEINQEVVTKLEERQNKFKRKRNSKKKEEEAKKLLEENIESSNGHAEPPMPSLGQFPEASNIEDTSRVVDTYTTGEQHENSEYTQIPGWNDIQCLFEQIDDRQLPDKNNLLAILKVCAYGRLRFLKQKNLPLNSPYNTYKEEYFEFRNKFYEEAIKKWENVSLDTFEDLHKVLMYLSQKEKKTNLQTLTQLRMDNLQIPNKLNDNIKKITSAQDLEHSEDVFSSIPSTIQNNNITVDQYLADSDQFISQNCSNFQDDESVIHCLENSDDDSLFELSFICDENNKSDKTNLFVHLEQLSSDIINNKLRQDSGFYDFSSDDSSHSIITECANDPNLQQITNATNEVLSNLSSKNSSVQTVSEETTNFPVNPVMNLEENKENQQPLQEIMANDLTDDCDNRSVLSDHDYCCTATKPLSERLRKRNNSRHEEILQNIISHQNCIACKAPKIEKLKLPKEKKRTIDDNELMPPPKRRKLAHKQIIKLLEGLVPAVQENHFEQFFSENYQPEQGEGEIPKTNEEQEEQNDNEEDEENESDDPDEENESDDPDEENEEDIECPKEDDLLIEEEMDVNEIRQPDKDSISTDSHHFENTQNIGEDIQSAEISNTIGENLSLPVDLEGLAENNVFKESTNQISENDQQTENGIQRHSDTDDTLSVFSEHSYSQPQENTRNDSGFVDVSEIPEEEEQMETNMETLLTQIDDIVANNDEPLSIEEEYQRILRLLEESQKDMINEQAGLPTEKQRKDQEAKELQTRVQEWEHLIVPKLKALNGQDFDIHEYGTKIMGGISINESKPFSQIVEGMTSAEVTRYFISSLQLANTNNIEICGVRSGEISNDTFEIKLLNRDRYHEHLDDYQAPSKESLREKLERLRNKTSGKQVSNRDGDVHKGPEQKKRRKVEICISSTTTKPHNSAVRISMNEPSTSYGKSNELESILLSRDTNNNRNKNKVHMDRNSSSKSSIENSQKGKSIKRKSFSTHHVSFEGSQAPKALSVQITSPRQLHTNTSLSNWNRPSTSYEKIQDSERFLNEEVSLNENSLDKDFQRLLEVQKLYSHYPMHSTPRNDVTMTFTQNGVYSSRTGHKLLFD